MMIRILDFGCWILDLALTVKYLNSSIELLQLACYAQVSTASEVE